MKKKDKNILKSKIEEKKTLLIINNYYNKKNLMNINEKNAHIRMFIGNILIDCRNAKTTATHTEKNLIRPIGLKKKFSTHNSYDNQFHSNQSKKPN